jgi:hypothetical protein
MKTISKEEDFWIYDGRYKRKTVKICKGIDTKQTEPVINHKCTTPDSRKDCSGSTGHNVKVNKEFTRYLKYNPDNKVKRDR